MVPDSDWSGLAFFIAGISVLRATERLSSNSGLEDDCEFRAFLLALLERACSAAKFSAAGLYRHREDPFSTRGVV